MANPCGFEYTNPKTGKKHYYKTIREYTEGILSGFIDISSAPELKAKVDKILNKNKGVMDAVYAAADKMKNKKEDFADALSNLNKIITGSLTEKEYDKAELKIITRAALAIGLKPNVDIAVRNFVETLDKINSSKESKRIDAENEASRLKAVNRITSAKTTSNPFYVRTLLEALKVPFSEVPNSLKKQYQELITKINDKSVRIETLANESKILAEKIKLELVGKDMEIESLLSRVDDFIENKDVSGMEFKDIVAKMFQEGFLDKADFDSLNSLSKEQGGVIVKQKKPLTQEKKDEIKSGINDVISTLKSSRQALQDSFDRATRELVDFILENTNDGFLDSLKDNELKNFFNTIEHLRLGYNSSSLKSIKVKLDAYTRSELIASEIEKSSDRFFLRPMARAKAGVKRLFGNKTNTKEQLFRNHLNFALDTILGIESKDNPVYSNLFGKSASLFGGYESTVANIESNFINPAVQLIKNIGGNTTRGIVRTNIRIGIHLVDAMHKAGLPNSPSVKEYFQNIMDAQYQIDDNAYTKKEKELIKEAINEYYDALENQRDFLTPQELEAANSISKAIQSVQSDAISLSFYSEGKTLVPDSAGFDGGSAYFPIKFKSKEINKEQEAKELFDKQEKEFVQPGFSANHLKEKAGVTSPTGKILDILDPANIALSYVREIVKKQKMQTEVATTLRTFDLLEKKFQSGSVENGEFYSSMFKMAKATYLDRVRNIVSEGSLNNSFLDKADRSIRGFISAALLTGISKFAADTAANIVNSSKNIEDVKIGVETFLNYRSKHNTIMQNLNVPEGKRLLIKASGEGFSADIEASGVGKRGSTVRLKGNEFLSDLNLSLAGPTIDFVNSVNENQIKIPDQLTAIPIFYGALIRNFKRITGEEINLDKVFDNDVDYMDRYRDALSKSVISAHTESTGTVGTKNPFITPTKAVLEGGGKMSLYNLYKEWMNFFNQYNSSMGTDILTARGVKDKSVTIGVKGASSFVYSKVIFGISGAMIYGLNSVLNGQKLEPNEEEEVKSLIRDIAETAVSLFTLNSNNATKQLISYGVEAVNAKFGEGVTREGEMTQNTKISRYNLYNAEKEDGSVSEFVSKMATKTTGTVGLAIDIANDSGAIFDEKEVVPKSLAGTSLALRLFKVPLGKDFKRIIDSYRYNFIYNKAEIDKIEGKTTEEERRVYNKKLKDYLKNKFYSMFFLDYSPEKSVYDNKQEAAEASKKHLSDVEKVLDPKITDRVTGRSQIDENKNLYYKMFLQDKVVNTKEMPLYERKRLVRSIEDIFIKNDKVIVGDKATMDMVKQKIDSAKKKGFSENKKQEIEKEKVKIDSILNGYLNKEYNEDEMFFLIDGFTNEQMKYDESEEYLREKLSKNEFKDLKYE